MDFNRRKFSKTSWGDDDHLHHHHMAMEDQTLHDHHHHHHQHHHDLLPPFDSLHQFNTFPLQTNGHDDHHHHQFAPSSSQLITSSASILSSDHVENHVMDEEDEPEEELGPMKEMMYKIASMQPVDIDPAAIRKPKRRNVRISDDPQSVAARNRRERISERVRILQRLVPGGTKLDTASMLEEAIRYVKFLKRQIRTLQSSPNAPTSPVVKTIGLPDFPSTFSSRAETETRFNFRVSRRVDGFAFNNSEVISDKS